MMMIDPAVSGFYAIAPAPAAPIRDCAHPVANAPAEKAIAAPIGTSQPTIFLTPSMIVS